MDIANLQRNIDRLRAEKFDFFISVYNDGQVHVSISKKVSDAELTARGMGKTVDIAVETALSKFPRVMV